MTLIETWNNLCSPAQLYFIITVLGFLFTAWGFPKALNAPTVIFQVLITIVWTYLLGWICTKGWSGFSWFLVLAPIVSSLYIMYTTNRLKNAAVAAAPAPKKVMPMQKKAVPKKKDAIDIEIENL